MRLATFNTRHGAPAEHRIQKGDPEALAEACASLKADVLALQEVEKGVTRSKGKDLAAVAAKKSGMEVVFAETMPFRGGEYGNALLVRGEITNVSVLDLPGGTRFGVIPEPRNAILARVCIEGQWLSIAATHLAHQRWASRRQLPQIIEQLEGCDEPQVLMGDLNLRRRQIPSRILHGALEFAAGPATFPSPKPRRSIDHIAVSGLEIHSMEAVRLPVSDHLALVVEVEQIHH